MLIAAALMGVGIGLAFAALGNLIVQAVPAHQTGVASGMNTVMRTLGGALGGQIVATLIADNTGHDGLPTVTGFTDVVRAGGGVPGDRRRRRAARAGRRPRALEHRCRRRHSVRRWQRPRPPSSSLEVK